MSTASQDRVETLLAFPQKLHSPERLEAISAAFLGTPYSAHKLGGGPGQEEVLTVDVLQVDCLSYLEYVTALTRAQEINGFLQHLLHIRYLNATLSWATRRHFFSDWTRPAPVLAQSVPLPGTQEAVKDLNVQATGQLWLPGVPTHLQKILWLPVSVLTPDVLSRLHPGDLIGSYTPEAGLDVTHTGFAIPTPQGVMFRNASSLHWNQKVVDTPLLFYMQMKKRHGLVVLRLM